MVSLQHYICNGVWLFVFCDGLSSLWPCVMSVTAACFTWISVYIPRDWDAIKRRRGKRTKKLRVCSSHCLQIIPLIAAASEASEKKAPLIRSSTVFVLVETLFSPIVWRSLEDVWLWGPVALRCHIAGQVQVSQAESRLVPVIGTCSFCFISVFLGSILKRLKLLWTFMAQCPSAPARAVCTWGLRRCSCFREKWPVLFIQKKHWARSNAFFHVHNLMIIKIICSSSIAFLYFEFSIFHFNKVDNKALRQKDLERTDNIKLKNKQTKKTWGILW